MPTIQETLASNNADMTNAMGRKIAAELCILRRIPQSLADITITAPTQNAPSKLVVALDPSVVNHVGHNVPRVYYGYVTDVQTRQKTAANTVTFAPAYVPPVDPTKSRVVAPPATSNGSVGL